MSTRDDPDFRHGHPVRIDAHVADVETGKRVSGRGRVLGDNPVHKGADGVEKVNVQLEGGAVVAVPKKALKLGN